MNNFVRFLETIFLTFFYSGKIPFSPWTFWSIFSFLFLVVLLFVFHIKNGFIFVIALFVFIISIPIINGYEKRVGSHDNSSIVIDEFVWMFICAGIILFFTKNIFILILGFVLFRFFDILKPSLIWYIDKNVLWGLWVLLDDVVAWVFSWVVCIIVYLILVKLWVILS